MSKIITLLGICIGSIFLIIGVLMKLTTFNTSGYSNSRSGRLNSISLDGYGVMIIGVVIVFAALLNYRSTRAARKNFAEAPNNVVDTKNITRHNKSKRKLTK